MTTLTVVTMLVVAYGVFGPNGYGQALALGGATVAGAALVVGGTAVPTFYAVAIGTVVGLLFERLTAGRRALGVQGGRPPGMLLLIVFFSWSVFVTVTSPLIFSGVEVLVPGPGRLQAGVFTTSNVAQVVYLALGVCVVAFVARSSTARPELIGLAAGMTILLSLWRYLHGVSGIPFPDGVFDNSPSFAFIESAPGGVPRFRGILSEPAGLAVSSLVAISYMCSRALLVTGWRRVGTIFVALVAAYLGSISTSATFVVGGAIIAAIAALAFIAGFLQRTRTISLTVGLSVCGLAIVALWVGPVVLSFVEATINAKVASSSFDERSGSNSASYQVLLETFGFGAGLGGSRASSFFAGLLGATGIPGTVLFIAVVAMLIYRGFGAREYRPVVWALVSLLSVKVVSGPDLSDSSGILWLSLGLLSRAALTESGRPTIDVV